MNVKYTCVSFSYKNNIKCTFRMNVVGTTMCKIIILEMRR